MKLFLAGRKCGFCYKDIKKGDILLQVPTDNNFRGFEYPHKECAEKALKHNIVEAA